MQNKVTYNCVVSHLNSLKLWFSVYSSYSDTIAPRFVKAHRVLLTFLNAELLTTELALETNNIFLKKTCIKQLTGIPKIDVSVAFAGRFITGSSWSDILCAPPPCFVMTRCPSASDPSLRFLPAQRADVAAGRSKEEYGWAERSIAVRIQGKGQKQDFLNLHFQ